MKEFKEILSEIENDKTSGSSTLADKLVDGLIQIPSSLHETDRNQVLYRLAELVAKRPLFATLNHILKTLESSTNWKKDLNEYKLKYQSAAQNIRAKFLMKIGDAKTFLLHSNSKTIFEVFESLVSDDLRLKIFQTKSEPDHEGVIQANLLTEVGFDVTIVDDNPPLSILKQADCFVTGADLIMDNEFINKSGTRWLAEKINALGKSYIVLADQRKFSSKPPDNLPSTFEIIPRNLITNLITE